jgi:hypothetical protein
MCNPYYLKRYKSLNGPERFGFFAGFAFGSTEGTLLFICFFTIFVGTLSKTVLIVALAFLERDRSVGCRKEMNNPPGAVAKI